MGDEIRVFQDIADKLNMSSAMSHIKSIFEQAVRDTSKVETNPVDTKRIDMFEHAANALSLFFSPIQNSIPANFDNQDYFCFLESYFSNYIEGTKFDVKEAEFIVYEDGYKRAKRSSDGHDVVALYNLIKQPPVAHSDAESYLTIIKGWHKKLMSHRLEKAGEFKRISNQAGSTRFVSPELVEQTLIQSFKMAYTLPVGLPRAAFLKLAFTEIHPFDDGNGRISRLIMNNELALAGEARLIVPTVFREDYLLALKAFSQSTNIHPFERMLRRLVIINNDFPKNGSRSEILAILNDKSAFLDANEGMWGVKPYRMDGDAIPSALKF